MEGAVGEGLAAKAKGEMTRSAIWCLLYQSNDVGSIIELYLEVAVAASGGKS